MFPGDDLTTAAAPDTESVMAPEAPTADASAPSPEDHAPDAPAGPPRGPDGRFAKGESDPTTDRAALDAPDGDAPDHATALPGAPDAPPGTPPAASPPAADVTPAPAERPFTFRSRGSEYGIDGARVTADGDVVIPKGATPRVQQLCALGRDVETHWLPQQRTWQQERATMEQRLTARDAQATALAQLLEEPDDERFVAALLEFRAELPALRQKSEVDALKAENARLKGQHAPPADDSPEAFEAVIRETTTHYVDAARQQIAEFQGLTEADRDQLAPRLLRMATMYIRPATYADEVERGDVQAGEPVFDEDAFVDALRTLAGPVLAERQRATAEAQQRKQREQAAKDAAARNKAVTTPNKAPPTTSTRIEAPAGSGGRWKTREEYLAHRQRVMSGG